MSCNGQLLSMTILVTYDMTISISPLWVGPREASIRNSVNLCSTWRDYWIMVIPAIPPDSVKSYLELEDLSGQSAWNTNGNTKGTYLTLIYVHSNNICSLLTKIYAIFIQISSTTSLLISSFWLVEQDEAAHTYINCNIYTAAVLQPTQVSALL